ncbi:MAG: MFS transporter [Eubacteriales bacterium]|nr:MFS transporter [Eubacteriales bacterium]
MSKAMALPTTESSQDPRLESRAVANMALMLAGKLVSLLGNYIYSFAMGLYVLRVRGSAMGFAVTLVFGTLPRVILAPVAGALADRLDRKKMVVGMDLVSGLVMLLLYGISSSYGLQVSFIYGAAAMLAIANTFLNVAMDAAIPNLVTDRHLVRINSLNQSVVSLTQVAAPFIGGLVFGIIDIRLFVLLNGIAFILSAVSEIFIDFQLTAPAEAEAPAQPKLLAEMGEGFTFLRRHNLLFTLGMFFVFLNFCVGLGAISVPYILNNVVGMDATLFGILNGLLPAGIFLGSLLISALPEFRRRYPVILVSLLVMALALAVSGLPAVPQLLAFGETLIFIFYFILLLIIGFFNPFVNIPVFVLMQRQIPDNFRGRVFGLIQTMCMAITPVAYLLAGSFLEKLPAWSVPLGAGLSMLAVVGLLAANKEFRKI